MNTISKTIFIVLCAVGPAPAAILSVLSPVNAAVGSVVDVDVVVTPGAGDAISGYQVDVSFPTFLSAQSLTARGYFAANSPLGISSDPLDPAAASLTTITQVLGASDQLPATGTTADYTLFSLRFLVTDLGTGSIAIDPGSALLFGPLDVGTGLPSLVNFTTVDAPITGTPEPSTLLLGLASLASLFAFRKRLR